MAVDDAGDDIDEIGLRLDADELIGLDQGGDHRPVLGATVRSGEQGILAHERQRPDGTFGHVVVDLDASVVKVVFVPRFCGSRVYV